MAPIFGRLHCPLDRFSFFSYFFRRRTQDGDGGFTSYRAHTVNVFDEPHSPFRATPPLTSLIPEHIQPPQSRKRKALLVGVEHNNELATKQGFRPVGGPHKDIRDMRQFLIDRWNYHPDDIILLTNTDDPETLAVQQPTRKNIEKYCVELTAGACEGDCFFFHFAGHTMQKPTDGEEEEDGKDEYIVTSDDEEIQDNALRKMLVEPLPPGAKLVAIFDACNSATLLDLEHHRCNRVFVPWVNKGFRRTQWQWNNVVRRCAFAGPLRSATMNAQENIVLPAIDFSPYNSTSLSSVMMSPTTLPAKVVAEVFPISLARPSRRSTSIAVGSVPDGSGRWYNCPETPIPLCDSPFSRYCTGYCRTNNLYLQQLHLGDKADVICLSSAKDSQRSWENRQGSSLTQVLIEFLKKTPNTTIRDVLTAVSHELHAFYLDMHQEARQYKQHMRDVNKGRRIRGKQPFRRRTVEMDNFQDPQISSLRPLDMDRLWEM